jgi:hypothetical protein
MQLQIQLQSNVLAGLRRAVAGLAGGLALASCGAGHDTDCLKSNGSVITQRRAIDRRLTDVVCYDNVDVTIVPDTANYAEVRAGKNVIDDIVFTYQGTQRLLITNSSRCNWVRSYNTPREVRLHVKYLKNVEQRGYGLISNEGQFKQDTLFVHSSSTGDINLNVNCVYLFIDVYDAGDMTLRGQADDFHPFLGSNGFLFASGLQTRHCYYVVYPSSYGDAHVRASQIVNGTSNGHGTFYYTGNPTTVGLKGPGRVVAE